MRHIRISRSIVEKHGLHSVKHIKNAPRRFESHEWFGAFLKCKESVPPTLLAIEAGWEHVGEWIDEPTGY